MVRGCKLRAYNSTSDFFICMKIFLKIELIVNRSYFLFLKKIPEYLAALDLHSCTEASAGTEQQNCLQEGYECSSLSQFSPLPFYSYLLVSGSNNHLSLKSLCILIVEDLHETRNHHPSQDFIELSQGGSHSAGFHRAWVLKTYGPALKTSSALIIQKCCQSLEV